MSGVFRSVRVLLSVTFAVSCRANPEVDPGRGGLTSASEEKHHAIVPNDSADIVFRTQEGRTITRSELRRATGRVTWEIGSSDPIPADARDNHDAGRRAGSSGRSAEALRLFETSARLAPKWPYPVYDAAFTYLLAGDDANALKHYERVLQLAPRGFFTAMTATHYLRLESAGTLPRGTYLSYVSLEWLESAKEKRSVLERLTRTVPMFAPAWKELALLLDTPEERLSALEEGLKHAPDPETRGFLLINKALQLAQANDVAKATAILASLASIRPATPG
jgi:tetratricopeptide (TPR) repeat protein